MDPATIISGLVGLGGLFGGRRRDPYQEASAAALNRQTAILDQILRMANAYDPARETQAAVDYGQRSAGNALQNMVLGLNQRFKNSGGSPTGDTNFALMMQRGQDDVLNPLAQFAANRKANEYALKSNALLSAAGAGSGMGQQWQSLGSYAHANQPDYSGIQALLSGVLGNVSQPRQKTPLQEVQGYGDAYPTDFAKSYRPGTPYDVWF